jgi:hypothetical protein
MPTITVGRFGAVVFHRTGDDGSIRRCGGRWETSVDGDWLPMEAPFRTRRDDPTAASFGSEERDLVVEVYAAVVPAPSSIDAAPGCTVLEPNQILSYLAAMPQAALAS